MKNPAQKLIDFGQSVWYDNISRDLLESGEIKRLRDEWGVRGMTSNPTIFDNAISKSTIYDKQIAELKGKCSSTDQIFEELAISDIARAADILKPIYDESNGVDGFVSIEVSPLLAANTQGTIDEARRLYKKLNRSNIMVKVPGTPDGIPAVRTLLEEGININITLLFSVENYLEVAKTYIEALKSRVAQGQPINKIRSVASFFVSRVDSSVDAALNNIIQKESAKAEKAKSLLGKFGIANSKIAYKNFQDLFEGAVFKDLASKGAEPQRPLWASTGTKNPAYSDVIYIDELIGKNTVNTIPHATLAAFVDHGTAAATITKNVDEAFKVQSDLLNLGVNLDKILLDLQIDGVKKFSESFSALNQAIEKKL